MSFFSGKKHKKWERETNNLVARGLAELEESSKWNIDSSHQNNGQTGPLVLDPSSPSAKGMKVHGYGIDKAIELLRTLPTADESLVTTIVQKTLESAHIGVSDIISDANNKIHRIENRIKSLHEKIEALRGEIQNHLQEIKSQEEDMAETAEVKRKLQLTRNAEPASPIDFPTPVIKLPA